jgi:hypothetical protein
VACRRAHPGPSWHRFAEPELRRKYEKVIFEDEIENRCLDRVGPASAHGACLFDFDMLEWEGYLLPGLFWWRIEIPDGFYSIYVCHKQRDTPVKNLLACPAGNSDFVFPNR